MFNLKISSYNKQVNLVKHLERLIELIKWKL